jgi:hypothetical protein
VQRDERADHRKHEPDHDRRHDPSPTARRTTGVETRIIDTRIIRTGGVGVGGVGVGGNSGRPTAPPRSAWPH